jgi:hypothetical protein
MLLCGGTFDEKGIAQTAASGGLRPFASKSRTAADQPKKWLDRATQSIGLFS